MTSTNLIEIFNGMSSIFAVNLTSQRDMTASLIGRSLGNPALGLAGSVKATEAARTMHSQQLKHMKKYHFICD